MTVAMEQSISKQVKNLDKKIVDINTSLTKDISGVRADVGDVKSDVKDVLRFLKGDTEFDQVGLIAEHKEMYNAFRIAKESGDFTIWAKVKSWMTRADVIIWFISLSGISSIYVAGNLLWPIIVSVYRFFVK